MSPRPCNPVSRRLVSLVQQLGSPSCNSTSVRATAVSAEDPNDATITAVRAIKTAPYGARLVIVKIETSVPGLTGVGCATFTQRSAAVALAVDEYLAPFLLGRRASEIEDIWQSAFVSSYWRSGPVLNNALSGVDQALWDIKGKVAGMPVHDLLGGKQRKAAPVYVHTSGNLPTDPNPETHFAEAKKLMDQGFKHIRLQYSGYGATESTGNNVPRPGINSSDGPTTHDGIYDPVGYLIDTPKMFAYAREVLGDTIELCHDTHERLAPSMTVQLAKALEPHRLFFLEDSLPPEQIDHFRIIRQHSTVPIAMGELFVNVQEYLSTAEPTLIIIRSGAFTTGSVQYHLHPDLTGCGFRSRYLPLIKDRLIDFIRVHMSDIGGLTPMIKLAALCEFFGVRVALHGPGDCSPVGMMANLAIDLSSTSFGIQEFAKGIFNHEDYTNDPNNANDKVFPGLEKCRLHDSMFWPNDLPGLGIDIDEAEAAKYPWPTDKGLTGQGTSGEIEWTTVRRRDGSITPP